VAEQNKASAVDFEVVCNNSTVEPTHLSSFTVDLDFSQPDLCSIVVRNEGNLYSAGAKKIDLESPIEIKAGENKPIIFQGKVIGLEPIYAADRENTLVIRGIGALHQLLRGTKSKTYMNQTDADIVHSVAGDLGLSIKCGPNASKAPREHVYQHNQADLEFLRIRAARLGYEIWIDSGSLYFDDPKNVIIETVKLRYGDAKEMKDDEVFLKHFSPKISSTAVVQSVTVRGWDAKNKTEIVGTATAGNSSLGGNNAAVASSVNTETFEVDHPIADREEAENIAKAKLAESMMGYITGNGECRGTPNIKPGVIVDVTVNTDNVPDRFNGKYMVVGATHRYSHSRGGGNHGGYITSIRVRRDAENK